MSESSRHHGSSLDDYLDGRLSSADRRAFESQLAADAALRAELRCQRSIEASLRRNFAPPITGALAVERLAEEQLTELASSNGHSEGLEQAQTAEQAAAGQEAMAAQEPVSRFQSVMATELTATHLAAGLAIAAVVALLAWTFWPTFVSPGYGPQFGGQRLSPHEFYQAQLGSGFTPARQCPPELLAQLSAGSLGQAVTYTLPTAQAGQVVLLGTTSGNVITPQTIAVLARVQDEPVLVLIDRAASCGGQVLPEDSRLHLHQRQLGNLVLYEVSPLPAPHVISLFHAAPADFIPRKITSCPLHGN